MEEPSYLVGALTLSLLFGSLLAWGGLFQRIARGEEPLEYQPRLGVPWTGIDVLVLVVLYFGCEIAAGGVVRLVSGLGHSGITPSLLAASSAARLAWVVLASAYLLGRGASYADLGFDLTRFRHDVAGGGWLFLMALVPVFAVQLFFTQFLDIPSDHPLIQFTRQHGATLVMILATFAAVVVAPVFEEFVFRVVLQGWLEAEQVRRDVRRGGEWMSRPGFAPLVVSSTLFALLHVQSMPDPAAIFVLSLFLGYAYRQTHRILPSLVIHACVNGWTMLNLWILYLGGDFAAA